MEIDRRTLLIGSLIAIAAKPGFAATADDAARFVSAAKHVDGSYSVLLLSAGGRILRDIPLSARGHDIAVHTTTGRAVAFARRPGSFALAFETARATQPILIAAADGRHFYGHGAFSADGRLLYATENDDAAGRGVIGIYDVAQSYRRIGEMDGFGVGPHELILMQDGRTLAIANGGIDTTAETGRANLNLDTMQPSLTFIDSRTGDKLAQHVLEGALHQLSIRHLATDASGLVWFGGQWEGDKSEAPELIGRASLDRPIKLIEPSAPRGVELKGYIGSMASSSAGDVIAASAPKAGKILYLNAADGSLAGETVLADGCGIAAVGGHTFATTSGLGIFRADDAGALTHDEQRLSEIAFDNHMRRIQS